MWNLIICSTIWMVAQGAPQARDINEIPFKMPEVQPKIKDTYLCIPMELDQRDPTYIVGFKPDANKDIAHHILLYGCTTPGSEAPVWNCGEMAHTTKSYSSGPVCSTGSQIIYAWAMDAPSLKLPKDVAFKVGGNTDVKYLVMQIHYKNVESFLPPKNLKDSSGVTLVTTPTPMPKRAGVYLLGTGGSIPPHSVEYMETVCRLNDDITIHPFGFRTHAHTHGEVVSGYMIRDRRWEEIGRRSPKDPQMFYNVTHPGMVVRPGDLLAARCTMKNDEDREVRIGATQNDEMCNFYIMYYVDGERILTDKNCFSMGPPYFYWDKSPAGALMNLAGMPKTVSKVPGSLKAIEKYGNKYVRESLDDSMVDRLTKSNTRQLDGIGKLMSYLDNNLYDTDYPGGYDNNV